MSPVTEEFVSVKDLARRMGLCTKSVKRWWQRLGVPPTIEEHSFHRWSPEDAAKLLTRWEIETLRHRMHRSPVGILQARQQNP